MTYDLSKLSKKSLDKILSVLDYIKINSELRNRKHRLFCRRGEVERVSESYQERIIMDLIRNEIVKDNIFWSAIYKGDVISIGEPFFNFYDEVISRLETKENSKKKIKTEVMKVLGITENTKWEDITIEFKNEYDVKIKTNGKRFDADYEKMGFADSRKNIKEETKAKESWELLRFFATGNSYFPLGTLSKKEKEKRIKNKQQLSGLLRNYFGIDDDPVYYNKQNKGYKIKIQMPPDKTFEKQWADRNIYEENSP